MGLLQLILLFKSCPKSYHNLENALSCITVIGDERIAADTSTVSKTASEGTKYL